MTTYVNGLRKDYLDMAKGVLIISVVIGHSPDVPPLLRNILYWFHLPSFFIISGYLFKLPFEKNIPFNNWLQTTFFKFFIPYVSFYLLISVVILRNISLNDIFKFLYGGRMYGGVLWYIPVLFLTLMFFTLLNYKFQKPIVITILFIMYLVGHIESLYYLPHNGNYSSWNIIYKAPLNVDVVLISLTYFAIGYYLKETINNFITESNKLIFLAITTICLVFIILAAFNLFDFHIDMKIAYYKNIIFDLIIPVIFFAFILKICKFLSLNSLINKPLSFVGRNTLTIMYLHIPINGVLQFRFGYGNLLFIIIGVVFPLIFAYICTKNKMLNYFFLGDYRKWSFRKALSGEKIA